MTPIWVSTLAHTAHRGHFSPSPSDDDTNSKANYLFTAHATVTDADGESNGCQISLHVSESNGYCMLTSNDLRNLTYVHNSFDHQPLQCLRSGVPRHRTFTKATYF